MQEKVKTAVKEVSNQDNLCNHGDMEGAEATSYKAGFKDACKVAEDFLKELRAHHHVMGYSGLHSVSEEELITRFRQFIGC